MGRLMKQIIILCIIATHISANDSSTTADKDPVYEQIKLTALEKGVPDQFLTQSFTHENIQIHDIIPERFAKPYEEKSWTEYKKLFVTAGRIRKGVIFYKEHREILEKMFNHYGVSPFLITSIIGVESNYGSHHKEFTVFNSLYTQIAVMPKRARWAKQEMIEFLLYCYKDNVPPHSVYGSYAGAFGYGQFIPSSFNNFAVDFDDDGVRQAYTWPDVMASIANYLVGNGYPVNSPAGQKKDAQVYKAVYAYNHADNYVKAVLALRDELESVITSKLDE
jgi:membrane-bound lytic murein transglycosylase B